MTNEKELRNDKPREELRNDKPGEELRNDKREEHEAGYGTV
jgi:hypothetical protein